MLRSVSFCRFLRYFYETLISVSVDSGVDVGGVPLTSKSGECSFLYTELSRLFIEHFLADEVCKAFVVKFGRLNWIIISGLFEQVDCCHG